jgi:hypothetical protein
MREAGIANLSLRLFDEYRMETIDPGIIANNQRTNEEKLASLRCFNLTLNGS